MAKEITILITCIGGGGANNVIRSLRDSDRYNIEFIGTDSDRFLASKSLADKTYVIPRGDTGQYIDSLNRIISEHNVDLFIPQHETEVERVSWSTKPALPLQWHCCPADCYKSAGSER